MADVAADLKTWSATASSNSPAGSTAVGTGLDDNLREIQKVVRQDLANKGADIASATTTDLGAVAGSMHDITGTTTITGFGTVSAGIIKWIKFEGVLTLTHNATSLILKYAQNHLTADGDVFCFQSEGSGNWRELSRDIAGGDVPPGSIMIDAGTSAPAGWLLCYGQAVSRTTYSAVFARLSTTYGVGDNATTFNLPDLRGRAAFGKDNMGGSTASRITSGVSGITGTTLGAVGGDENLHAHFHLVNSTTAQASAGSGVNVPGATGGASGTTGAGTAQNMPPAIILNYIIKT